MKRLPALLIALAALLPACAFGDKAPVVFGAVYPTGGVLGEEGLQEYRGVRLAAELANRDGGIDGRPIELRLEPANTSDAAPQAVKRLDEAGVDIVLGSYSSVVSRKAALTASELGMLFWETGAVGEVGMSPTVAERVFRFASTGQMLGGEAVAFVRDELAARLTSVPDLRYAVVYVDDVYGRSVGEGALEEIRRSGLTLSARIGYELASADYRQIAQTLKDTRTDVLVVAAYLEDGVAMRREIVAAEVPLLTSIGTSSSYCHPAFGEALGPEAVGLFASDKPDADFLDPSKLQPGAASELKWARDRYRSLYKAPMSGAALSGFSAAWALFHHVMPVAKGLSADEVANALRAVRLERGSLPNGSGLEFGGSAEGSPNVNLAASSVIWEWVRPSERAIVWPPAFANSPIVPIPLR